MSFKKFGRIWSGIVAPLNPYTGYLSPMSYVGRSLSNSSESVKTKDLLTSVLNGAMSTLNHMDWEELFDSLVDKYTDKSATGGQKERAAIQLANQQQLDADAYQRKIDFYEQYESPAAMVRQYQQAGLNPMLLAGSGAGASATGGGGSSASEPSAASPSSIVDILGSLAGIQQKNKGLELEKMRIGVAQYEAATRRQQMEAYSAYLSIMGNLGNQQLTQNEQLFPLRLEQAQQDINRTIQDINSAQAREALDRANISVAEAEAALKVRQAALTAIQEKHADRYYSLVNANLYYQSRIQKTQNEFERRTLETRIRSVEKQLDLMLLDETSKVLSNGIAGMDFSTYKQRNAREWVNTGIRALGAVAGLATGAGVLGKAAGLFGGGVAAPPSLPGTGLQGPGSAYMSSGLLYPSF